MRNCNYEKSKELWMYRAYNGCVHLCAVSGTGVVTSVPFHIPSIAQSDCRAVLRRQVSLHVG